MLVAESKPEWGLIQEHLKGDPMLANLNVWKKELATHIEVRLAFEKECSNLLREKTGYELVDQPGSPPFLYYRGNLGLIIELVLNNSLGVDRKTRLEEVIKTDTKTGTVLNSNTKLAEAPGKEESCKANIIGAIETALDTNEAAQVVQTYKELAAAVKKAKQAIEEIILMELVPGECRVCRRFGR